MIRVVLLSVAVTAALLSARGGGDASSAATTHPTPAAQASAESVATTAARGRTIRVVDSQFGKILADGRRQAVYVFDKERTRKSECYGACAKAWPPVLTSGRPVAERGAKSSLLGTTRRRGGRLQVTYRGQPLYYYVSDRPGRVLCHGVNEFGGLWLVIRADGSRVPS